MSGRAPLVPLLRCMLLAAAFAAAAGCGSDGDDAACTAMVAHLQECGADEPGLESLTCSDATSTCSAHCVSDGSCAEVTDLSGTQGKPVNDCIAACQQQ